MSGTLFPSSFLWFKLLFFIGYTESCTPKIVEWNVYWLFYLFLMLVSWWLAELSSMRCYVRGWCGIIFHNPLTVITPDSHMTIFIILFTNMRREINIYIHCVIILSMSTYRTIINKSNQSFIPPHNCWASYMMIYDIKYIDKVLTQPPPSNEVFALTRSYLVKSLRGAILSWKWGHVVLNK